ERIANVPVRGIGAKTIGEVMRVSSEQDISPLAAATRLARGDDPSQPQLRGDLRSSLAVFIEQIDGLAAQRDRLSVAELLDRIIEVTHYHQHLQKTDGEHAEVRWENVQELRSVAAQYVDVVGGGEDGSS